MISHLQEIRADGKVIDETMDFDRMSTLGWAPCRVTKLRWQNDGRQVEVRREAGVVVQRLHSGRFLPALVTMAIDSPASRLCVLNADGSLRLDVPDVQLLAGHAERGAFGWFEKPPAESGNVFRVVFEVARNQAQFAIDIDAESGRVLCTLQMS